MRRILTFDIEEWFHLLDTESTKSVESWSNYEVRIHKNIDVILNFLKENNLRATFFVLGWIAEKYPEVVKKIDSYNFDIGSHTHYHQLMYEQSKNEVREDLIKSIAEIENLTGKKVNCFRAPGFSITEENKWVLEILIEQGITYDSSIFPASRAHGGFPSFGSSVPSIINFDNHFLKEFPINTGRFMYKNFVYSGGGYFRIFPYEIIKYYTKKSPYVMTYFHPRDFDSSQPIIKGLSVIKKFKSYVGISSCLSKLEKWTSDFEFDDLITIDQQIDWDKCPIINL